MFGKCWFWLVLAAVGASGAVRAGEVPAEGPAPGQPPPENRRERRLEPLRLAPDAAEAPPAPPAPAARFVEGLEQVNAVDAVGLALAQAWLDKQETDKAIEVLLKVAESVDKTAAGYARLALARIYRQKGDAAASDEQLAKVTGPALAGALEMIVGGRGPEGEAPEAAARLEGLLGKVSENLAKAVIIRRLTDLYRQAGDAEKLAALAERAQKLLGAKEAAAILEEELRFARQAGGQRGPMADFANRARGALEDRVRQLEAEGRAEEAAALRERAQRFDRLMRGGGGRGAMGRGRGGADQAAREEQQADALRKQIKELEDAGQPKEAEALKERLRLLEERRARRRAPAPAGGAGEMF